MARRGQTFRVFVSSTFSDLKAERDALQAYVFPRLRDLCERHGARFQAIDLRWGVSQQASRDQRTMNICLSEIARCQDVTPRPNFIVLLGDRYGWCPPPSQIPAKEFDEIVAALETEDQLTSSEKRLLLWQEDGGEPDDGVEMVQWDDEEQAFVGDKGWYRRDENAEPDEYVLQPWDGFTYDEWSEIEEDLHAALERGARAAGVDDGALFKYWASATHQEIAAGAMSVPDADEHVFAFFRHIDDLPKNEEGEGFVDLVETDEGVRPDADARERLLDLKADLRRTLGEGNVERYDEVEWTDGGPSTDHIDQLCDDVYQALSSVIKNQLADLEQSDPLEAKIAAHEAFGEERAEFFTGRAAYLRRIADYVEDASPHPFALWGESGSGKSALLAKAVEETQEAHPKAELIYRFIGASPESSNGRALLEGLCRQISRRCGADESDIPLEYKDLAQEFPERLSLATAEKPLILFIDALNQLSDMDNAKALTWLPAELPENVRLVVSTAPGDCRDVLERKLPPEGLLELEAMPEDEAEELLKLWLKDAGRELQPEQRRGVLTNPKPLYLKLAFEEARRWHSYDGLPTGADDVPGLSDDIEGVIGDLFARLSSEANHGEMLVSRSLGYLAAAKNGLTEDELLNVLARDVDVYVWFLETLFHTPPDLMRRTQAHLEERREGAVGEDEAEDWLKQLRRGGSEERLRDFLSTVLTEGDGLRLPVVLWSRLYADLEPYLTQQRADGTSLLSFYHPTTFGRAVKETYLSEEVREARYRALARYFEEQPLVRGQDGAQRPNLRKLSELPYQQAHGHQWDLVRSTLTDFDFLQAKTSAVGPRPLIQDYDVAAAAGYEDGDLCLVRDALQLSAHILAKDDEQLPGQLTGRLTGAEVPAVQGLLEQIKGWRGFPWLRLLTPTLAQPGGALMFSLTSHVTAVAVTSDGRRAVSGSGDDTLRVWDLQSRKEVRVLEGHTGRVRAVALTPDGRRAVSGSSDGTVRVWDLESGEQVRTLRGHTDSVTSVAVTPDGSRAVSGSNDKTVKLWDLETGEEVHSFEGHRWPVSAVAVSDDGTRATSGETGMVVFGPKGDHTLKVWDLETGEELRTLEGHRAWVLGVAMTPDGARAVSGSEDCTLKVWDLETGEELNTLNGHTDSVEAVAVSPDGTRAVSASADETLKVWDLDDEGESYTLQAHSGKISGVALALNGTRAVSISGDDRTIRLWDLKPSDSESQAAPLPESHSDSVSAVEVTPDGTRAVSGSKDKTLKVWDLQTGQEVHTLKGHTDEVNLVAVTPDASRAVSASSDNTLRVWDLQAGEELRGLRGDGHSVSATRLLVDRSIAFEDIDTLVVTLDGTRALCSSGVSLRMWDLAKGERVPGTLFHASYINAVALIPDGKRAVTASTDKTLKVWDLKRGKELHTLAGHTESVNVVGLSPDGTRAISGSNDKTLKVWDLGSGEELRSLEGHRGAVRAVAVTPDGKRAVSCSYTTIKVWDLESGELEHTIRGHRGRVRAVAVTPDGTRAVSCATDCTLKVWDLATGEAIAAFFTESAIGACSVAPDGLTFVAGGKRGEVHVLHLQNVTLGPAVVTSLRTDPGRLTVDCVRCRARSLIDESHLGSIVDCPHCGAHLRINPSTVEASERPPGPAVSTRDADPVVEEWVAPVTTVVRAPAQPDQPPASSPEPTPVPPPLPLGFAAEQLIQSPLRQHASDANDELALHQWLATLLDEHRGLAEDAAEGRDLDALQDALHRQVHGGAAPPGLTAEALTDHASERARAAGQHVVRLQNVAAAILAAGVEVTTRTSKVSATVETRAHVPQLPLSFGAEQMIRAALRFNDKLETSEMGANQWLVALISQHRELLEDLAGARDLKDLEAGVRQQLDRGEIGSPLTQEALIDQASRKAQQASRQVVTPRDLASVILTADPDTSRLMHRG